LAIQPDGQLVAAGIALVGPSLDFALARYRPAGHLDRRFGSRGTVTTDFAGDFDEANALAIQPDGRLVAAGTATITPGSAPEDFGLSRYFADVRRHR
jgi:uncharacterized delta-60 repeat protein